MDRYAERLRGLYALAGRGVQPGLDRVREALRRMGDPQSKLRVVHVAGTNGKGSVCAMLEASLRAAGMRTGLYTSPHLHRFTERIRIDGAEIDRDEVVEACDRVTAIGEVPVTYFEIVTAMAFDVFARRGCEIVVLETGLGGRLDATNVIDRPLACAITAIARDHERLLGEGLRSIAGEKAGILKKGVPAVVGARDPEARAAIEHEAAIRGAPLARIGEAFVGRDAGGLRIALGDRSIEGVELGLRGAHQDDNAAVAAGTLWSMREVSISDEAIRAGLASARWAGRLERISDVLLDAAHNPQGFMSLAAYLRSLPDCPRVLLFGAMADKDWRAMLDAARPELDAIVTCAPEGLSRAEDPRALAAYVGGEVASSVPAGLDRARTLAKGGLVVVAGSIFVMAEARAAILGEPSDPPIAM